MNETGVVFVVGSFEHGYFIIDRVYFDQQAAIAYSDSRRNAKYHWAVLEMRDGADWLECKTVHNTERAK